MIVPDRYITEAFLDQFDKYFVPICDLYGTSTESYALFNAWGFEVRYRSVLCFVTMTQQERSVTTRWFILETLPMNDQRMTDLRELQRYTRALLLRYGRQKQRDEERRQS